MPDHEKKPGAKSPAATGGNAAEAGAVAKTPGGNTAETGAVAAAETSLALGITVEAALKTAAVPVNVLTAMTNLGIQAGNVILFGSKGSPSPPQIPLIRMDSMKELAHGIAAAHQKKKQKTMDQIRKAKEIDKQATAGPQGDTTVMEDSLYAAAAAMNIRGLANPNGLAGSTVAEGLTVRLKKILNKGGGFLKASKNGKLIKEIIKKTPYALQIADGAAPIEAIARIKPQTFREHNMSNQRFVYELMTLFVILAAQSKGENLPELSLGLRQQEVNKAKAILRGLRSAQQIKGDNVENEAFAFPWLAGLYFPLTKRRLDAIKGLGLEPSVQSAIYASLLTPEESKQGEDSHGGLGEDVSRLMMRFLYAAVPDDLTKFTNKQIQEAQRTYIGFIPAEIDRKRNKAQTIEVKNASNFEQQQHVSSPRTLRMLTAWLTDLGERENVSEADMETLATLTIDLVRLQNRILNKSQDSESEDTGDLLIEKRKYEIMPYLQLINKFVCKLKEVDDKQHKSFVIKLSKELRDDIVENKNGMDFTNLFLAKDYDGDVLRDALVAMLESRKENFEVNKNITQALAYWITTSFSHQNIAALLRDRFAGSVLDGSNDNKGGKVWKDFWSIFNRLLVKHPLPEFSLLIPGDEYSLTGKNKTQDLMAEFLQLARAEEMGDQLSQLMRSSFSKHMTSSRFVGLLITYFLQTVLNSQNVSSKIESAEIGQAVGATSRLYGELDSKIANNPRAAAIMQATSINQVLEKVLEQNKKSYANNPFAATALYNFWILSAFQSIVKEYGLELSLGFNKKDMVLRSGLINKEDLDNFKKETNEGQLEGKEIDFKKLFFTLVDDIQWLEQQIGKEKSHIIQRVLQNKKREFSELFDKDQDSALFWTYLLFKAKNSFMSGKKEVILPSIVLMPEIFKELGNQKAIPLVS